MCILNLKGNSGAYLARNIGSVFSNGGVLIFVDDDGLPETGMLAAHANAHDEYLLDAVRGGCLPKNPNEKPPGHYHLGDKILVAINCIEGNCSYRKDLFFKIGGWGDYILFGHGGAELCVRMLANGSDQSKHVYIPNCILRHDYYHGEKHAKNKRKKQAESAYLLSARDSKINPMVSGFLDKKSEEELFQLPTEPHMSEKEKELFNNSLELATSYFEFGAGGSTVWAVNKGLIAYGVESDPTWVRKLKIELGDKCKTDVVDIGPTGKWGRPESRKYSNNFPKYSLAILGHNKSYDLILVDGRFRVSCVITTIQHLLHNGGDLKKARIFIHDFWNRPQYHIVLQFLDVVERVDTAGIFRVASNISESELSATWDMYCKVID